MEQMSAEEVAGRLERFYREKILVFDKYGEICSGCKRWFSSEFNSQAEFQEKYAGSDFSFVNILASCLKSKRRMMDFLCVCNPWALWHFDVSIRESIQRLKSEGDTSGYLVPASDVHFLKNFSLFVGRSGKK